MQDVNNKENCVDGGKAKGVSVLSAQFFYRAKTFLKNKDSVTN